MSTKERLVATGLSDIQARAYILLLEVGSISPPNAARRLKISRTNAYKLLDKLVDIGIAKRSSKESTAMYEPNNPLALSNLVAEQRNLAARREDAVRDVLNDLTEKFQSGNNASRVVIRKGKQAVIEAYKEQLLEKSDVYFLRSRSDIPTLGFDTMHDIRITPGRHGNKRFGITPDSATGTKTSKGDERSELKRTWIKEEDYTAPVEWSATKNSLLIIVFGAQPHALSIQDSIIADAFMQLLKALDQTLRQAPYYEQLPR